MTEKEIRKLLEHEYAREQWKQLITTLFPTRDVFARPIDHEVETVSGKKLLQHIVQFGDVHLSDGNQVALFEVEVAGKVDLSLSRVAIRKAIEQPVKQGGHSGALIAFVDKEKNLWRFSFFSNTLSPDGTWDNNNPKRHTYLLGEGEKCRTAAEQFYALAKNEGQVTLKDLKEAFSVEKVSKAFFREYKEHYQDFVQHLTGKRMVKKKGKWVEEKIEGPNTKLAYIFKGNEKDARDFCKKLMGRLVFLYFLQKKRWLGATTETYDDGDLDFVGNLFRDRGAKDFYQHILVDLFFETLNRERDGDEYTMPDASKRKVPFLNGGLFDKESLDIQSIEHILTFPSKFFSNPANVDDEKERGFLDFLNAYNFTVHEAGPEEQTLAVDPEMLGHIFENLLEDNKDKGAFYTPKEIVHYMCQESLTQYLKNYLLRSHSGPRAGIPPAQHDALEAQLRRFLQHGEWAELASYSGLLLKALREVKVCDPAIGSGAFPMGILHEIFQAVEHINVFSPDETQSIWELKEWDPAEVKLSIIQHSIYGVDIERGAVDIARLRFWLSIIVDERAPRTLPNLDYKIVVGDSLLGKFNKEVLHIDWELKGTSAKELEIKELVAQLGKKSAAFFRDQPIAKKLKLSGEIRGLKIELLSKQIEFNRDKYSAESARTEGLFEPTKKDARHVVEVQGRLALFKDALRKLNALAKHKDEELDCFDWQLDFPEILNKHVANDPGFDIVIGNPPYVRQEAIKEIKSDLEKTYPETFTGIADLFVYFIHLGHKILRDGGVFAYIVSNKWMRAGYGAKLRGYLGEQRMQQLLDFGEQPVFEATTYTCILISRKSKAPESHSLLTWSFNELPIENLSEFIQKNAFRQTQEVFTKADYLIGDDNTVGVYSLLKRTGVPFSKYLKTDILRGLLTGFDEAFVIDRITKDELIGLDKRSTEVIKPFIVGRDIRRFGTPEVKKWLILFPSGSTRKLLGAEKMSASTAFEIMHRRYPAIMDRLAQFEKKCKARSDQGQFWWELRACDYYDQFELPKIAWPETAPDNQFTYVEAGTYQNKTSFFTPSKDDVLLAILNSKTVRFFLDNAVSKMQGGYYMLSKLYISNIPIVAPRGKIKTQLEQLVQKRLKIKAGPEATALESEIDILVFKLYSLTWQQAKVVDPTLELSEAAYNAIELPEQDGPRSGVSEPGAPYGKQGVTGLTDEGTLFGQPVDESENRLISPGLPLGVLRDDKSDNNDACTVILKFLKANKGLHGKSAIIEATGVKPKEWNAAINRLMDDGKVQKEGIKKGVRYKG